MKQSSIIKITFVFITLYSFSTNLYAGLYEEGCKYFSSKNYEKAREMFLKNIETSDNGNAYYFLGEIEKNEGNLEKAEEYYQLSVTKKILDKYKKLAYWNLIVFKEQKGKYGEMAIVCRESWEAMKDEGAKRKVENLINKFLWTDNDEAKALYMNGIESKKNKSPDKAREYFYSAINADPNFLAPKFELGLISYNENNARDAIYYFKDIVAKIPFYGVVHYLLGDIYYNYQYYSDSAEHLEKADMYGFLDNKTKYSLLIKLGTSYFEISDLDKALEKYTAAVELNKKSVDPLLMLSAVYIKKNEFDQAIPILLKAKALTPNNTEILFQIGSLYYRNSDPKYEQYFRMLFNRSFPAKEPVPEKYFKAFTILFKTYYEKNNYRDANKISEQLPESESNYEINLLKAKSLYYSGNYKKAIELFEKLSLTNDDNYLLCISYAKSGIHEKAKEILYNLSANKEFMEKAKHENSIKKIAAEIENENKQKEEAQKKATENNNQITSEDNKNVEENTQKEEPLNKPAENNKQVTSEDNKNALENTNIKKKNTNNATNAENTNTPSNLNNSNI